MCLNINLTVHFWLKMRHIDSTFTMFPNCVCVLTELNVSCKFKFMVFVCFLLLYLRQFYYLIYLKGLKEVLE